VLPLLLLLACTRDEPAPDARWRVDGGHLRDPDGRVAILRGANVANAHKSPPFLAFHQEADYARLRDEWGWNAIRFLLTWEAVEPEDGAFDELYLDGVEASLDDAHAAGLLVVLDMHQDLYGRAFGGDGFPRWTCAEEQYAAFTPTEPWFLNYLDPAVQACFDGFWGSDALQARYAAAWTHVAARFADHPAVIGFDVMNEPHWGSAEVGAFEAGPYTALIERVVAEVRAEAPEWIVFVEPSAGRNLGIAPNIGPFAFEDLVYAPHSYDSQAESGEGFDEARRDAVLEHVAALRAEADALGAALWVGEYGGTSGSPGIAAYADAELDAFDAQLAGAMWWSYDADGGYGLLDADSNPKEALLDAVLRPAPSRIAGEPASWSWDGTSFELAWEGDGVSEIAVPPRSGAPAISCEGCSATAEGPIVTVESAGPAVLRLDF
jgi:endoglycosylceramidase